MLPYVLDDLDIVFVALLDESHVGHNVLHGHLINAWFLLDLELLEHLVHVFFKSLNQQVSRAFAGLFGWCLTHLKVASRVHLLLSILFRRLNLLAFDFAAICIVHQRVDNVATFALFDHHLVWARGDLWLKHWFSNLLTWWTQFLGLHSLRRSRLRRCVIETWMYWLGQITLLFLLSLRHDHRTTLITNSWSVRCLGALRLNYTLQLFLSPVLMGDLILHKFVEAASTDLMLPLSHQHSRLVDNPLFICLVPLSLRLLISNLLIRPRLWIKY